VTICWNPDHWEQPVPGSRLWHAVLDHRLAQLDPELADQRILREEILRTAARYPDLDSWWSWVRSGWTAPPASGDPRGRGRWRAG
jgi:hypothetical protein